MAKVVFGQGVSEMRGSNAGTTFSRNRGGAYTRNRVTPTNPKSPAQNAVRNAMTLLSTAWGSTLTQAQRDGWQALAEAFPTTDSLGAALTLTGLQLYMRQNSLLVRAGIARVDAPPVNLDVVSLTTLSATVDVSDGTMALVFTPTPIGSTSRLQVFATPGISPGVGYVKNKLRLIATTAANVTSPQALAAAWQAVFGAFPVAGQKVIFEGRILNTANGSASSALQASTIVVA